MFRNAISWALKKIGMSPQMLVGYALLIALSGVASVCAVLWWKNAKLETDVANQSTRLVQAELVIDTQTRQIENLEHFRELDQAALSGLFGDVGALRNTSIHLGTMLTHLESKDENIRNYMDSPVPSDVSCMYDDTCRTAKDNSKNGTSSSASPVIDSAKKVR